MANAWWGYPCTNDGLRVGVHKLQAREIKHSREFVLPTLEYALPKYDGGWTNKSFQGAIATLFLYNDLRMFYS